MKGRWTQYEEDSSRLPEGFKRIGYDAETRQYSFCDANGAIYQGEPGLEYGVLMPIPHTNAAMERARPSAFASSPIRRSTLSNPHTTSSPKTFQDILPPELITSSSTSGVPPSSPKPPVDRFVSAVRKSALPKMQGVVHQLRRSVTSVRRPRSSSSVHTEDTSPACKGESETMGLIRGDSTSRFNRGNMSLSQTVQPRHSPLTMNSVDDT